MDGHGLVEAIKAAHDGQKIWNWDGRQWVEYTMLGGVLFDGEGDCVATLPDKIDGWKLGQCDCPCCRGKTKTEVKIIRHFEDFDKLEASCPKENGRFSLMRAWAGRDGNIIKLKWSRFPEAWRSELDVRFGGGQESLRFISGARPGLDNVSNILYTPGFDRSEDSRVLCWNPDSFVPYEILVERMEQLVEKAEEELTAPV